MRQQSSMEAASRAGDLEQVELDLALWRGAHRPPTPIPEELWAKAAELAARHGVGVVARALALNQTQLKRRMEARPVREEAASFVELLPPPMSSVVRECAVEFESHRGLVRILMKDVPGQCLGGILQGLVG